MSERLIVGEINLLKVLEWEPLFHHLGLEENPSEERLLEFLSPPGLRCGMSEFRKRYRLASEVDQNLWFSIGEPQIRENVFGPLRQAKVNLILGNYLGSIALCGIVAEKLAILVYALETDDETQRREFEKMRQADRIKLLKRQDLIEEESVQDFGNIRAARTTYLHHWKVPDGRIVKQALEAYAAAARLFLVVINADFKDGVAHLDPKLLKYLEDRGAIRNQPQDD